MKSAQLGMWSLGVLVCVCLAWQATAVKQTTYTLGAAADGTARKYQVFVPDNYEKLKATTKFSVIFYLHAFGESCGTTSFFKSYLDTAQAIMVTPCSLSLECTAHIQESLGLQFTCKPPSQSGAGSLTRWNAGKLCCSDYADDGQFVVNVLKDVQSKYNINMKRVYVTGFSMGCMFTEYMMCEYGNLFQGSACAAGALMLEIEKTNSYAKCDADFKQNYNLRMIKVHGDQDTVVPYAGTAHFTSAKEDAQHWATRNGCSSKPTSLVNTNSYSLDDYPNCKNNATFRLMVMKGQSHGVWGTGGVDHSKYFIEYFGLPAKDDVDPCAGVNCGAHGSCSNGKCVCMDGYTGSNCNTPPNPCAGVNCGAHGSCTNGKCVCTDGYTGSNCNTPPTDPCAGVNCGAHGSCSNGECVCTDGYTGSHCDTPQPTDPCAGVDCGAHGSCTNGQCVCTDGYTGSNCNTPPTDPCAGVDCGAHGSCTNGKCVCTDGYTGSNCDTPPTDPTTCWASATDVGSNTYWMAFNVQTQANHAIGKVVVVSGSTSTKLNGPSFWGTGKESVFSASLNNPVQLPFTLQVTDSAGAVNTLKVNAFAAASYTCA